MMVNLNPGYKYDKMAFVFVEGLEKDQRAQCLSEIKRMPDVNMVASCYSVPLQSYSFNGNP